MQKTYVFNLVQNQYFKNIDLTDKQIQQLLYQQFDFLEWYLSKSNLQIKRNGDIKIFQFCNNESKNNKKSYLVHKFLLNQSDSQHSNDQQTHTLKNYKYRNIIILHESNIISNKNQSQNEPYAISYSLKVNPNIDQKKLLQHNFKDIQEKSLNCQNQLKLTIKFKSLINSQSRQNQRKHIKMILHQLNRQGTENSVFDILDQFCFSSKSFSNLTNYIPLKLQSANSYLTISQGYKVLLFASKNTKPGTNKKYELVFRKFHSRTNKVQMQQKLFEFSDILYKKIFSSNSASVFKKSKNEVYSLSKNNFVFHHYICSLSNTFVPFLFSLSKFIDENQQKKYLQRFLEIIFPVTNSYLTKQKKNVEYVVLSDEKYQEIKKTLNFIINKLILQYSQQITLLAAELSFIFQIVELLNQSLINKSLVQNILLLLMHYGGMYPEILLKADKWVSQLNQQVTNKKQSRKVQSNQTDKNIPLGWYSLHKIIAPGTLTRFKTMIKPLLDQILENIHQPVQNNFTFQNHFKITSSCFTIVAFDITCHTVRFFNHLTVPKMNMLQFLFLNQSFQCIKIQNQWTPYRIVYENQTFLVNLQNNIVTAPIGIEYLEQYLDSEQICRRYFNFDKTKENLLQSNTRWVFVQSLQNLSQLEHRQTLFQQRRHQIVSQIKRLIFDNIPKTKLIWRFIKFEGSSSKSNKEEKQNTLDILKKIEIINHIYNLIKTLVSSDKNLSKQIWLEKQSNFLDEIKIQRKNFVQDGCQQETLLWEVQRIKSIKQFLKKPQNSAKNFHQSIQVNVLGAMSLKSESDHILSQNQLNLLLKNSILRLDSVKSLLSKLVKQLEVYQPQIEQISNAISFGIQKLSQLNQTRSSGMKSQQSSSQSIIKILEVQVIRQVKEIQERYEKQLGKAFEYIRKLQNQEIINLLDKQIQILSQYKGQGLNNTDKSSYFWFQTQVQYYKMIQKLVLCLQRSVGYFSQVLMKQLFFECGCKEFQIYARFLSNFSLISRKMDTNIFLIDTNCSRKKTNSNKIHLVIESMQHSQNYTQLYLRLLFEKLRRIQEFPNSSELQLNLNISYQELLSQFNYNREYQQQLRLQNHFQSIVCSDFTALAILQLIFDNNFKKQRSLKTKNDSFKDILLKLPSMKHLLSWTNTITVQKKFSDFNWHLLEEQHIREFYETVYTPDFVNELLIQSSIERLKLSQIQKIYDNKIKSIQEKPIRSIFSSQRRKITKFLIYQILEQWIQVRKRNSTQNAPQKQPNLRQQSQIRLQKIIQRKVQYNTTILQNYSILEKQQISNMLKKYMSKFGVFIEQIISTLIDTLPHSYNQWKGILLKDVLSSLKLKRYLSEFFISYNIDPHITFQDLYRLSKGKFQGPFTITLWNCRKGSIDLCNHITKPKMPLWVAIVSACSYPFYMHEQLSHCRWQNSTNSKMYPTFRQFPRQKPSVKRQSLNTQRQYNKVQINRTQSKLISQSQTQLKIVIDESKSVSQLQKKPSKPEIGSLIDQQVNKYLNSNLLQSFPLIHITNKHVGMIKSNKNQFQPKIMTISYQKYDGGFYDRIKNSFFEGKQISFNIGNAFSMYFNKKDKKVKILRQFIRKTLKETHFYQFLQITFYGNSNLYKFYRKQNINGLTFDVYDENSIIKNSFLPSSLSSDRLQKNENNLSEKMKNSRIYNVRLSNLDVQYIDCYGDIINLNQNNTEEKYKFYPTFHDKLQEQKQFQYYPQESSKNLVDNLNQILEIKQKQQSSNEPQASNHSNKVKIKTRIKIKSFMHKYICQCSCFGLSQNRSLSKRNKGEIQQKQRSHQQ